MKIKKVSYSIGCQHIFPYVGMSNYAARCLAELAASLPEDKYENFCRVNGIPLSLKLNRKNGTGLIMLKSEMIAMDTANGMMPPVPECFIN